MSKQAEVFKTFDRRVELIRNDSDLTDEAKRRHLAEAWHRASSELQTEREELDTQRAERQAELLGSLFNPCRNNGFFDSDEERAIRASYREALFLVEKADLATQGETLLQRAALTGDKLLAHAVGAVAFEQGHLHIVEQSASYLDKAEIFQELVEVATPASDGGFAEAMHFFPPAKPREIENLGDVRIAELAGADV